MENIYKNLKHMMPFDTEIPLAAINSTETKVLFHKELMYLDLLQHCFVLEPKWIFINRWTVKLFSISTSWNITWPLKRIKLKLNQITWRDFHKPLNEKSNLEKSMYSMISLTTIKYSKCLWIQRTYTKLLAWLWWLGSHTYDLYHLCKIIHIKSKI